MSSCELCGAPEAQITAQVEGVQLKVCRNCQKHGVVKSNPISSYRGNNFQLSRAPKRDVPEQKLVHNFAQLLREARETRNLNNQDFAKLLQEKESAVAKWESGSMRPPIPAAIKMGRILGLHFIERSQGTPNQDTQSQNTEKANHNSSAPDELTLGDFIKVRKR